MTDENESEAFDGLFVKMRDFVRDAIEQQFPASAVTLEALKKTKAALAKRIFAEAVIAPARRALVKYRHPDASRVLEDLETKFLQEPVINSYYEVEVLVASRLLEAMFEDAESPETERLLMGPVRNKAGVVTSNGWWAFKGPITSEMLRTVTRLAAVRERRVQLLLLAEVVGREAANEAINMFTGYRRGSALEAIWGWLKTSGLSEETRRALLDELSAKASDESIMLFLEELEGTAFLKEEQVRTIADELFSGEEEIEF